MVVSTSLRPRSSVTRSDYVAARVLLIVGTLALVAGSVARMWPDGPLHFQGGIASDGPAYADPAMPAGVSARFTPELTWVVVDATFGQRLVAALPALLALIAGLAIAWSLWQLLNAAGRGEPFTRATVRCSQILAVVVLAWATMAPFVDIATQFWLVAQVSTEPAALITLGPMNFVALLASALLVVLTQVYARGVSLREDADGLV